MKRGTQRNVNGLKFGRTPKHTDRDQLEARGVLLPRGVTLGRCPHPPIDKLVWTDHAKHRFAERVTDSVDCEEIIIDFVRGRTPSVFPMHTIPLPELETDGRAARERKARGLDSRSPYYLDIRDVCRLILGWSPWRNGTPDAATNGVWCVVTVFDYSTCRKQW